MDKELEEAKKYLEYKVDKRKQGRNFFIDYEEEFKHEQTLLNYIENSISREVIEKKLTELKKEYKEALETNSTKVFILKCQIEILQELLEK